MNHGVESGHHDANEPSDSDEVAALRAYFEHEMQQLRQQLAEAGRVNRPQDNVIMTVPQVSSARSQQSEQNWPALPARVRN